MTIPIKRNCMKRKMRTCLFLLLSLIGITPIFSAEKQCFLYSVKGTDSLYLDLYSIDSQTPAPCVIFMFGGGFYFGERDADIYKPYFHYLNDKGYSVVSIDYRLGLKNLSEKDKSLLGMMSKLNAAVTMAVEDLYDATLYVLNHAENWNIDVHKILTSGVSAGAVSTLQAEFELCNGSDCSACLPKDFHYAGVISFAGAVLKFNEKLKWKSKPCPILFFHGDADRNVPYYRIKVGKNGFYGSGYLVEQLEEISSPYYFYSAENVDHSMAISPMSQNQEQISRFLESFVEQGKNLQIVERVKDLTLADLPDKFKLKEYISANFPNEK